MARDLKLFYWFRLLATSYLWFPVFFFFKIARGLSPREVMALAAVYSVTVILIEIPTGAFADRIGRRVSMAVGALAMVVSCLLAYFAHSFPAFVVAEVFAAISIALCSGADSAYLFDLLKSGGRGAEYARREGHASALHLAGSVVAFEAGGQLGAIDLGLPFLVNAGVALIAFFIALSMTDDAPVFAISAQSRGQSSRQQSVRQRWISYQSLMSGAIRMVTRSSGLVWIIGFSAVCFMLLRATDYLYQPYLRALGFGVAETAHVLAAIQLIAAAVALNVDRFRRVCGEALILWGMLATLAASFILLNRFEGGWALAILAIQAVVIGLYSPLVKPIINRQIIDSSQRATVLSIESIARRVAAGVFIPIIGLFGEQSAIEVCGVAALVGLVILVFAGAARPKETRLQPIADHVHS